MVRLATTLIFLVTATVVTGCGSSGRSATIGQASTATPTATASAAPAGSSTPTGTSSPGAPPGATVPGATVPGATSVPAGAPTASTPIVIVGFNPAGPALPLLDDVQLYVNLGDSLADGANAPGGRGYRELLFRNQGHASYVGHDVSSRWPAARHIHQAKSGAQSGEVVQRALSAMRGWPDTTAGGDVIVTISMGGNDFNDEVATMLLAPIAQAKAAALEANYQRLIDALARKYEHPAQGRRLVLIGITIYDPTDGTGQIPVGLSNGFCGKIARFRAIGPALIGNLDFYNDAIRRVLAANDCFIADDHTFFMGHGMASAAPWYSNDCAHANAEGHHQIRRNVWHVITGQLY